MSYKGSVIITGGTINLGYYAALEIARAHPEYLVVISSRSDKEHAADTINKTLGQANTIYIPLDLASLQNVRQYAEDWAAKDRPPIHALLLNAGLQFPGPVSKTVDGLESTFAINHVGHALLFHLLRPHLAANARVVVTSSGTHDPAQTKNTFPHPDYISAEELAHPTTSAANPGRQRYAESKLANVLWTYALHRRLTQRAAAESGIAVTAFDPGLMPGTGLAREANPVARWVWLHILPRLIPLMRLLLSPNVHTAHESGTNLARLAVGPEGEGQGGKYFEGPKPIKTSPASYEEAKQEDLWRWTVDYLARNDEEKERFEQLK
ncbi:NAD(P)-binding protein [Hypoxylon rubiginosum]|uniref:NAD(P)-binding protein n=1 Tax=Hypoxylon rubiginosum TaxID=110542 RepID=A0ACC0CJB3_9PEZI|nr:NAD(P)-binding protein [Hypoxylon rubiginosum]